jgi:cytochrome P450
VTDVTDKSTVSDWATDFDHADPAWAADPYAIWEDLRDRCPVAHSDRYGGVWLPTRHEDVSAVAYDTEHFTSRSVVVSNNRPMIPAPQGIAPPISSDPPFHHGARRLLLPAFSPKAVAALEPRTRAYCEELIDAMGDRTVVDAAVEYAQHIPVRVIAHMLGFPEEDGDIFRGFVKDVLEGVDLPPEERFENFQRLDAYLQAQIQDHLANIVLLLIAGIDTTWSAIGASLWHLAKTPTDRERLVAEPELMPFAMEELLRAYAPVTMARLVKEDVEWRGRPMKQDDWVLLPFPSANRDSDAFEQADEVVIDRKENRHAAFGLGIHRCVGSNLARMELRVALETWLARIPVFELADPDAVTWSHGQVRGPRTLPLRVG